MTVYTVHEKPPGKRMSEGAAERFVFVRDGFHFWAFLLGPLWMLWNRLWLVFGIYAVVMAVAQTGLWALGVSGGAKFTVGFLIALLVGLEAPTLRRWTYRRWIDHGVVVAADPDEAERRFFDRWTPPRPVAPPPPALPSAIHMPPPSDEVIGLFPEPQSPR
jgi:hypothetical protein